MLENWNKPQKPDDAELEERLKVAREKLAGQQMKIKEHGLPVLVLFEGWGTAGKGSVLGKVIRNFSRWQLWMYRRRRKNVSHFCIVIL